MEEDGFLSLDLLRLSVVGGFIPVPGQVCDPLMLSTALAAFPLMLCLVVFALSYYFCCSHQSLKSIQSWVRREKMGPSQPI